MGFTQLPSPEVIACTGSTNHLVAERFQQGQLRAFAPLVARHQRSGHGRMGHEWFAPADSSLLFSTAVTLPLQVPAERLGWVSLISSLAVADLVKTELGPAAPHAVDIKWPNDVLLGGRKVCGILTQYLGTAADLHWICVGVGLNLTQGAADLDPLGATSLALHGWAPSTAQAAQAAQATLTALAQCLNASLASRLENLAASIAEYTGACSTIGGPVTATLPGGGVVDGTAVGLSDLGELLIDTGTDTVAVTAGEVTIGGRRTVLPTGTETSLSTTCEECK